MNRSEEPDTKPDAMVILPSPRCSPETPGLPFDAVHGKAARRRADNGPLTEYLPSLGQLPATGPSALPLDLDEERAAARRAALEGPRPDDEHLALLDRVLHALRRL
ncbi:hypothetical protein ACFS2C_01875 [Prauserella oleivorans]|nr:hypothetical protein [Prauserella flavalba]